jgi:hypothetical protein
MGSVPRCYKQDKSRIESWGSQKSKSGVRWRPVWDLVSGVESLDWWVSEYVRGMLRFSRCELLLLEAGSWERWQFGNPEEGELWRWKPLHSNG